MTGSVHRCEQARSRVSAHELRRPSEDQERRIADHCYEERVAHIRVMGASIVNYLSFWRPNGAAEKIEMATRLVEIFDSATPLNLLGPARMTRWTAWVTAWIRFTTLIRRPAAGCQTQTRWEMSLPLASRDWRMNGTSIETDAGHPLVRIKLLPLK
jgi:hypothetical protein